MTISLAELVKHVLVQAINLGLYEAPPRVPGQKTTLDRQASKASTTLRTLSSSSSRSKSVMDFVLSPSGLNGSPRRTLSKASKTSSVDSKNAASIFSSEDASTAITSVVSHEDVEASVSRSAPSKPGLYRDRTGSLGRSTSEPRSEGKVWFAGEHSNSSRPLATRASSYPDKEKLVHDDGEDDHVEELDQSSVFQTMLSRKDSYTSRPHRSNSQGAMMHTKDTVSSGSASRQSVISNEEKEEEEEILTRE